MNLRELALMPLRVTVAATQATLGLGQLASPQGPILREGGYASRIAVVFGDGGLVEQVTKLLDDEQGALALLNRLAEVTADDRPIGRALARDGLVDRLAAEDGTLLRLLEADGPVDRLLAEDGPLYRFLAPGGALDRLLAEEGAVERILAPGGLVEQLLAEQGILEKLLEPGGTVDRLVALGDTFDALVPRLESLGMAIPTLNRAVESLNGAVKPLAMLAGRVPGNRRRPSPAPAGDDASASHG